MPEGQFELPDERQMKTLRVYVDVTVHVNTSDESVILAVLKMLNSGVQDANMFFEAGDNDEIDDIILDCGMTEPQILSVVKHETTEI